MIVLLLLVCLNQDSKNDEENTEDLSASTDSQEDTQEQANGQDAVDVDNLASLALPEETDIESSSAAPQDSNGNDNIAPVSNS